MDKSEVVRRLQGIKRVQGLRASPPGGLTGAEAPLSQAEVARQLPKQAEQADVRSLESAGWTFAADSEQADTFEIVLDADGHVKISGPTMTARFDPALTLDEILTILEPHGLSVRRALKFSANTFLLDVNASSAIETAQALNARDDVLYAEPSLIEPIQSR